MASIFRTILRKQKMKRFDVFILLVFTLVLNFSCDKEDESLFAEKQVIISIKYGTSFGECQGYCKRSIEITESAIKFMAEGWYDNNKLPDIYVTQEFASQDWQKLGSKIDLVIFRNLEEVIGCPDCDDGGAEWIEITTTELSHKITFECDNEPEEVKEYIEELSALMEEFDININ